MSSPSLQHPDHVPAAESPTIAIHAGQRAPVRSAAPHDDPTELLPMASDGGTRVIQPRQVVSEPQTVLVRPRSEAQPIRRPRERVVQSTPQVSQVSQVPQVPPSSERHGQPDGTEPAPPITDAPRVGSVLDGRWRLTRLLGQGGMGQVWLGADLRLPTRTAAVKTMHTRFVEDPSFRERFAREQTIMATVDDCPHIPALLDVSAEDAPTPYYAMQVIRGATLRQITQLGHGKPVLSPHDTCTVMVELLEGLCGIHRHGIIHRDLKPGNLIITPDGRLIITDFGIAKPTDPEADQVTRFGQAVGSNDYASPEQRRGEPVDERSDVYSAGIIWREMLVGGLQQLKSQPKPQVAPQAAPQPKQRSSQPGHTSSPSGQPVPSWIRALCSAALRPDPDQRPSAAELLERLRAGLLHHPTPTESPAAFPPPDGATVSDPAAVDSPCTDDDIDTMRLLGNLYFRGSHCLARNLATAGRWYARAAAEGDLKALYNLGGVNQAAGHRAEAQACFRAVANAPSVIPSLRDLARSRLTAQR